MSLKHIIHDAADDLAGKAIREATQAAIPEVPLTFDPTATKAVAGTLFGALAIVVTGTGTLIGLLSAHDLVALFVWLHGADGLAYVSAVGLVATIGWRAWVSFRKHTRAVVAASAAPDAVVK